MAPSSSLLKLGLFWLQARSNPGCRGLRSLFKRARGRQALLVVCGLVGFGVLSHLERRSSDVRATRAEITSTIRAISAWRADHDRVCPGSLADLVSGGYLSELPRDA